MKKLICLALGLVAVAACRTTTTTVVPPRPSATSPSGGAPDAKMAVQQFLAAAETQDLQAMASIWGTKDGAARDNIPREELEKREVTMLCYLKHDKYDIVSDAPAAGGMRVFAVAFTKGDVTRAADFNAVPGPAGRWFVQDFNMPALSDLCKKKG